jgi:hypothetical protein
MLNDPLYVKDIRSLDGADLEAGVVVAPFRTIDIAPGSSSRVGALDGDKATLDIRHSSSKENAPYDTIRSNVRFTRQKVDANGKVVTLSANYTVAAPQGSGFSADDVVQMHRTAAHFLLYGAGSDGSFTLIPNVNTRILAGEP